MEEGGPYSWTWTDVVSVPKGPWEQAVCVNGDGPPKASGEVKLSAGLGLGAPETELRGDPGAHSTHEGTGTTSSPQNTNPRDTIQTQITPGGPPNRATDENDNVSNRRQFNINFTQINLNKQNVATGDLALFIKNKEKPFVLVQEPHVNGKNVITRLTRDAKIIASRNTDSRPFSPRACIYYNKAMTKQLWIKDALTTTDCAVAQTLVDGKNTILASCYMDRNDALCPP